MIKLFLDMCSTCNHFSRLKMLLIQVVNLTLTLDDKLVEHEITQTSLNPWRSGEVSPFLAHQGKFFCLQFLQPARGYIYICILSGTYIMWICLACFYIYLLLWSYIQLKVFCESEFICICFRVFGYLGIWVHTICRPLLFIFP